MKMLFLTIVTLFSMEAMAGQFLYTERAETPAQDLKVVNLVELKLSMDSTPTQILIGNSDGKRCILFNRDLSRDKGNEFIKIHQELTNAMKNHNVKDGTVTVVYCDKNTRGDVNHIVIKTLRVEQ